jgi:hypothetical protein
MNGNLVTSHILGLESLRVLETSRAYCKEGGVERLFAKEIEQVGSVGPWTVIVGETPSVLVRAGCNISRPGASGTGPPASCISGGGNPRGTGA